MKANKNTLKLERRLYSDLLREKNMNNILATQAMNKTAQKKRRKAKKQTNPLVSAPVSSSRATVSTNPSVNGSNSIRVTNREFITTVQDRTDFPLGSFNILKRLRINPASEGTFPWLSRLGKCFETFKFIKLELHFYNRCSSNTSGSLIMSPDYDSADAPPSSEVAASSNPGTTDDAPWKEQVLRLSPQKMNRAYKSHFIMTDNRFDTSSQDEKTIDPAQVFIAIDSNGTNTVWGKVWIDYVVDLQTPQSPEDPLPLGGTVNYGTQNVVNKIVTEVVDSSVKDIFDTTSVGQNNVLGTFKEDYVGQLTSQFVSATNWTDFLSIPQFMKNGIVMDNLLSMANIYGFANVTNATFKKGDVLSLTNFGDPSPVTTQVLLNMGKWL